MNTIARLFVSAILFALLSSCSGGSAVDVAGKFWGALNDGDLEKAKSYATEGTAESLTLNNNGGDTKVDVKFGTETVEGGRAVIETHMVTRMGDFEQAVDLKTVLVQEGGEWKVDVMNTMMSMFGGAMGEMMQGMTDAMGQAMEGMGEALMQGMQDGFSQLGGALGTSNPRQMAAPEQLSEERDYRIKFGYMKRRPDDTYYVSKESTKLPMRTNGFKWGYTIESEGEPFTTYSIDYAPDGPMDGRGYPRTNSQGEQGWESNTTTVTDGSFFQAYRNDPGDTRGERKIEVFIEDKLATTIEFTIGK